MGKFYKHENIKIYFINKYYDNTHKMFSYVNFQYELELLLLCWIYIYYTVYFKIASPI